MRDALAVLVLLLLWGAPALAEETIHNERSLYRNIIVTEDHGLRCMKFSRRATAGRQSCEQLEDPQRLVFDYTKMMMGALYLAPEPRRILIIGLGGGSLPGALAALPNASVDVVEIDGAVIRVARQFFGFRTGPNMRVFEEDGRVYVKRARKEGARYDLVMLDAFDHEYIPEHLLTREFLDEVKGLLSPGGVLAANTFSASRLYDHESTTYAAVFGRFYNLKIGNRVILTRAGELPPRVTIERNAATLEPRFARMGIDKAWLLALFSDQRDWNPEARVLTDQYSPSNLLNTR